MFKKYFCISLFTFLLNLFFISSELHASEFSDRKLNVDVSKCLVGERGVEYWAFGSDHYKIISSDKKNCIIYVGGERENPNWDGFLALKCTVPKTLGIYNLMNTEFCINRERTLYGESSFLGAKGYFYTKIIVFILIITIFLYLIIINFLYLIKKYIIKTEKTTKY